MLLAFLIPSAGPVGATQETSAEKILRIRQPFWPDTLDPQKTSYVEEISVSSLDYEGLTRFDEQLNTVPAAAESWEFSEDGTRLTFHLRDGLTYSDGSPLTAERFRFAIERACDPNTAAVYAGILFDIVGCEALYTSLTAPETVETLATPGAVADDPEAAYEGAKAALGVRAIDDQTLEVQLTHPAPYFPTVASTWVFYPVKEESLAAGEGWAQDPAQRIGNGPFRMSDFAADQQIGFRANEHYWQGRPKLDGIEFVYVDDPACGPGGLSKRRSRYHATRPGPNSRGGSGSEPGHGAALCPYGDHHQPDVRSQTRALHRPKGARGLCLRVRS